MGGALRTEEKRCWKQKKISAKKKRLQSRKIVVEQLESGQVLTWRTVGSWTSQY
jgi:hypothetical protein